MPEQKQTGHAAPGSPELGGEDELNIQAQETEIEKLGNFLFGRPRELTTKTKAEAMAQHDNLLSLHPKNKHL